ncbi:MAG: TrkA family potassium uptake protein [Coriobacteriales bacterium]|jgi:trk system potassium uptake protein TrkA|nr:TrkA family potassium uptake protein [Coriobacteriales bacterium]
MRIVINGGGKVGEYLANTMYANGHQIAIIEIDKMKIARLAQRVPEQVLLICGDGCNSEFQKDAGAAHADIFVTTTGADDVNLVSCEIASLVLKVPRVIARVSNPKNERIFRRMGIEAVSSTMVISRLIEIEAIEGALHAVLSLTQGDLVVTEISLPANMTTKTSSGKLVADIAQLLPANSLLVAVSSGDNLSIVKGSTVLYPGDLVIVASKQGQEGKIRAALQQLW